MEHYAKSAAIHRSQHLRHAMVHSYLGDTSEVCKQLLTEMDDLERRLKKLERDPGLHSCQLVHTCKEMLYGRHKLFQELTQTE